MRRSSFDAWLLDIPYRRAIAVCFCCDCCCSVRQGLRLGPAAFWETVVRLPGLSVTPGPDVGRWLGEQIAGRAEIGPGGVDERLDSR